VISLKKNIEAFDYRMMFEAALESYRAAIDNLEKSTIGVERDRVNEYRLNLQSLRKKLSSTEIKPESLRQHAEELREELHKYQFEIESLLKGTGNDLRDVVAVLAEATETLSQRENLHGGQLSRISGGLETIAQIDDVDQIRKRLSQHVLELRTCIDQMSQENESALQGLQQELKSFQKRLEKVQVEASTDPLTGVANRRRAAKEISTRVRERREFGILLFDLNKFKQINDTHGHGAGDSVLQIVAQRLQGQVRKDDLVCRWGGDEFIVVHEGRAQELKERAREIANRIAGKVSIKHDDQLHDVMIGTEVGWAEYLAGESPEQLFARADRSLYESKQQRPVLLTTSAAPKTSSVPSWGRSLMSLSGSAPQPAAPPNGPTATPDLADEPKTTIVRHMEKPIEPKPQGPSDPATGLAGIASAEEAMVELSREGSEYFVGCFGFRRAALVNAHYRYPATEELLPFLRDKLRTTRFNGQLFRGPGASILALVASPGGAEGLEKDLKTVTGLGWEEHLQQKRRASKLPVAVIGKVLPLSVGVPAALRQIATFLTVNQSADCAAGIR
jgi:diguanylate cyclase (GGDEF)-like protein